MDNVSMIEQSGTLVMFWGAQVGGVFGGTEPALIDQIVFESAEEAAIQAESIAGLMAGRSSIYRIKGNIAIDDSDLDEEVKYWN